MGLCLSDNKSDLIIKNDVVTVHSWPRLLGKSAVDAKVEIIKDTPDVYFEVIDVFGDHGILRMDYKFRRVRLFVDSNGFLCRIPKRE